MRKTYIFANEHGQITHVDSGDETVIEAPDWVRANAAAVMAGYRLEEMDGTCKLVARPRLFDAETLVLAAGETFDCEVPRKTTIAYARPDLPLVDGEVQSFRERMTSGRFEFMSQKPGSFAVKFRDCFPYQDQDLVILVGEPSPETGEDDSFLPPSRPAVASPAPKDSLMPPSQPSAASPAPPPGATRDQHSASEDTSHGGGAGEGRAAADGGIKNPASGEGSKAADGGASQ